MDLIILFFIGGVLLLGGGLLLALFGLRSLTTSEVARRLDEYVIDPTPRQLSWEAALSVRRGELAGSFGTRVMLPTFRRLGRLFGRLTPSQTLEVLNRQLVIAGNPLGLRGREFYGLRLLFNLLGFWLAFSFLRRGITQINLITAVLALYVCLLLPRSWLRGRVRTRQGRIRHGLPDALDMLSVCAEAGLGFDQSLQRVSEHWQTPLGTEFGRVVAEMEMGLSRSQALRNLAERLDVSELSSFVAVILQSDQLGMSIAETLHAQARQMREDRRFSAQEQARKIPLKMLFPMLLLILPAMFAVVLGPSIPILIDMFTTVNNATR
jgi:tight adherence protein C